MTTNFLKTEIDPTIETFVCVKYALAKEQYQTTYWSNKSIIVTKFSETLFTSFMPSEKIRVEIINVEKWKLV
jgi:hypothetical protein